MANKNGSGCHFPARYLLACLAHLGFAVVYALRVNLSVALVAMVNSTFVDAHSSASVGSECKGANASLSSSQKVGEFEWDQNTQGIILGSFFYGYIVTQLPGGMLSARFGGKWVFGIGVLITSVLTIVTPPAAKAGVGYLIGVRVLEGLGEGVTFPSMHAMLSKWAPPLERSKLATIAYSGLATGTILSLPLSGLLCDYGFAGGWPSVFYVFGGIGVLWFLVWAALIQSTPEKHPTISDDELRYIQDAVRGSVSQNSGEKRTPWLSILTSFPFWSIAVSHFCNNWLLYTALTSLPMYFKDVLSFNTKENGFLSALPFLLLFILQIISGYIADMLRSRGILTTRATRKVMNSLGLIPSGIFLIIVSYLGCSQIPGAVVLMTLAVGCQGFSQAGFMVNHLDIAPNFASILFGLTNIVATIPGCVSPSVVGAFTQNQPTRGQWQKFLFLSAGISFFGGIFFLIFSSGEEQTWNGDYDIIAEGDYSPVLSRESDEKLNASNQYGSLA